MSEKRTVKNEQLYAMHATLMGIKQERNIPPVVLLQLMRILRTIEPAVLDCEKIRLQLLEDYAARDASGEKIKGQTNAAGQETSELDPARANEFNELIAELMSDVVQVPCIPASALLRIPDGVLTLEAVTNLEPLLIDDEVQTVVLVAPEGV